MQVFIFLAESKWGANQAVEECEARTGIPWRRTQTRKGQVCQYEKTKMWQSWCNLLLHLRDHSQNSIIIKRAAYMIHGPNQQGICCEHKYQMYEQIVFVIQCGNRASRMAFKWKIALWPPGTRQGQMENQIQVLNFYFIISMNEVCLFCLKPTVSNKGAKGIERWSRIRSGWICLAKGRHLMSKYLS